MSESRRSSWLNRMGLGMLGLVFVYSAWRVLPISTGASSETGGGETLLRFAHVTIHAGIIRSYDEAIADYEALHPGVRIEQVPVPLKLWASWLRTQVIGGTVPDLADMDRGQSDEFLGRYFLPLDDWTARANPYNHGTPLDGLPWRETFVDGLVNGPAYRDTLQQTYGIPLTLGTVRVFANAGLLKKITGTDTPPRDYDEFMALCEKVRAYAAERNFPIVPVSGSRTHGPPLIERLFASQTQRLAVEINPWRNLAFTPRDAAIGYLRGDWNWRSPAVLDGLEIAGEVGRQMVQGFSNLQREDSLFLFTQGRALMLATGSWEADTVLVQCDFPLIVFDVPLPGRDNPRYGANLLGPVSELGLAPGNAVGVTRASKHQEIAVDFLRFLSSRDVSRRVMHASNRLSSVTGVDAPPGLEAFDPLAKGWPAGFPPELRGVGDGGAGESARIYQSELHRLVGPGGSAELFAETMEREFPKAVRRDLQAAVRATVRNARTEDVILASLLIGGGEQSAARASRLTEVQTMAETQAAQIRLLLAEQAR